MNTFEDMNLSHSLLKGIYAYGYQKPAPIQQQLIVPTIEGRDIIAQAQSGMGKTGFFVIGILQNINPDNRNCQSLIVVPTRELAVQTQKVVLSLSKYIKGIRCRCVTGGSLDKDINRLRDGVHIVVGTPGRVIHMAEDRYLDLSHLKTLVLDEADKLLDDDIDTYKSKTKPKHFIKRQSKQLDPTMRAPQPDNFEDQLKLLRGYVSNDVQTILTSATMRSERLRIYKSMLRNPLIVMMKNELLTLEGISQYFIETQSKFETLLDLYSKLKNNQTLIFCNTKRMVERISENLPDNVEMWYIHGGMKQTERDQIFRQFLFGQIKVLVTSDLLCRGIDVQQVSVVVNFDLPIIKQEYIHRVGRAGRYGRKGFAINLISAAEWPQLDEIQKYYNTHIEYIDVQDLNLL